MIKAKVLKSLNEQLNFEFHSAYHYLSMESFFRGLNLNGFARWMRKQYHEERKHGLKIYDFIHEREGKVRLNFLAEPPQGWDSPLGALKDAYQQEQFASGMINDLIDLAITERDHATDIFLKWFVERQVDEEALVGEIVKKLTLIGDDRYGLYLIDRDMH